MGNNCVASGKTPNKISIYVHNNTHQKFYLDDTFECKKLNSSCSGSHAGFSAKHGKFPEDDIPNYYLNENSTMQFAMAGREGALSYPEGEIHYICFDNFQENKDNKNTSDLFCKLIIQVNITIHSIFNKELNVTLSLSNHLLKKCKTKISIDQKTWDAIITLNEISDEELMNLNKIDNSFQLNKDLNNNYQEEFCNNELNNINEVDNSIKTNKYLNDKNQEEFCPICIDNCPKENLARCVSDQKVYHQQCETCLFQHIEHQLKNNLKPNCPTCRGEKLQIKKEKLIERINQLRSENHNELANAYDEILRGIDTDSTEDQMNLNIDKVDWDKYASYAEKAIGFCVGFLMGAFTDNNTQFSGHSNGQYTAGIVTGTIARAGFFLLKRFK